VQSLLNTRYTVQRLLSWWTESLGWKTIIIITGTGRTEYQLLLLKASDRGSNVILGNLTGCALMNYYNIRACCVCSSWWSFRRWHSKPMMTTVDLYVSRWIPSPVSLVPSSTNNSRYSFVFTYDGIWYNMHVVNVGSEIEQQQLSTRFGNWLATHTLPLNDDIKNWMYRLVQWLWYMASQLPNRVESCYVIVSGLWPSAHPPYPPLGLIWTVMLVWRKGNSNRTVSVL